MHSFKSIGWLTLSVITYFFSSFAYANVNSYFDSIKNDPNSLYVFLKEMPKGGELHFHLAGGAEPETMLALAAQSNYCLDTTTYSISREKNCTSLKTNDLFQHPDIYQNTLKAWSMKDFIPGMTSGHDHFFDTFLKFMPVVADFRPQLLAQVMKTAADQNERYMEIIILPDNANSATFAKLIQNTSSWSQKKELLLSDPQFRANIKHTISESTRILEGARHALGCKAQNQQAVCRLKIKFLYYVLREQPLDAVFAQALNGFAAASESNIIVGVNLVQAEDGIIALRDYRQQMKIFEFMHEAYPKVHISLHAGELAPSSVPPAELRFHISDALHTAHAERIGHGVDIAYENNAAHILKFMAQKAIPVEINLISNREILGVFGKQHPLLMYLKNQVPIVFSTDDEGVLRTDLTRQYVEAAFVHGLDYPALKQISRNSITYAFIPGKSIWADQNQNTMVPECLEPQSTACKTYIAQNEKAALQFELESALSAFEKRFDNQ